MDNSNSLHLSKNKKNNNLKSRKEQALVITYHILDSACFMSGINSDGYCKSA